jgi:hypothetical protein
MEKKRLVHERKTTTGYVRYDPYGSSNHVFNDDAG